MAEKEPAYSISANPDFATVVTPPDALTQISLTIPLYLMYEITLFLGQRARRKS